MFKTTIEDRIKSKAVSPGDYSRLLTEIAEGLEISKSQLRRIRKMISIPNGKQLAWLAQYFDCTIDDLVVGWVEEAEPQAA